MTYGIINWNKGDEPVQPEDAEWAKEEKEEIEAAYVIAGGLKGVMMTDALQGAIMLIGMIVMFAVTYYELGGFITAHQTLTDMAPMVPKPQ